MPGRPSPWFAVADHLRPEGRGLVGLAGALALSTALPLAGPQVMRRFVDSAIAGRPERTLLLLAVAYLAVGIGGRVAAVATSYVASGVAWRATNRLREHVADHALRLDMAFHGHHTPGEMIERVDGDLLGVTEFASGFVAQAAGSALTLVGTIVLVFLVDGRVGMCLCGLVGVSVVIVTRAQRMVVPRSGWWRPRTSAPMAPAPM
jgi:ATP-binding cassette subfamily B protein/ATP-binding cassette subfamily C protein